MNRDTLINELERLELEFASLKPELSLTVYDPDLDLEGYVVVWNTAVGLRGPLGRCGKGGTRITPTVSFDEIKMLAHRMALKNAGAGLPLGGAKSGLRADPSAPDFEKRYRRFVSMVKPILHENGGIFGGFGFDIGARPEHALWACDELKSYRSFTGKPVELGGTDYDREGIAGLGVAVAAKTLLEFRKIKCDSVTFGVQGIGAMGAAVVRYFSESGAQLRAVSDPRIGGTVILRKAASTELLTAIAEQNLPAVKEALTKEAASTNPNTAMVLFSQVDVLFPCAVHDVLDHDNAKNVKARFVIEGANNPTSVEAYHILRDRSVDVVPDFIANPGGVIAAYVELTSKVTAADNAKSRANVSEAKRMTSEKISANVRRLYELVDACNVTPYRAARYMALKFMLEE
jgi:glutamate dehydrogenase (NAD(P)+)